MSERVRCPSCEKLVSHGEPHTCYSRAELALLGVREWISDHVLTGPDTDRIIAEINRRIELYRAGR